MNSPPPPSCHSCPFAIVETTFTLPVGLGKGWGQGTTPGRTTSESVATSATSPGSPRSGEPEALSPFRSGAGPVLSRVGPVELGPTTIESERVAVQELALRMMQLEAAVSKQDTYVYHECVYVCVRSFCLVTCAMWIMTTAGSLGGQMRCDNQSLSVGSIY